MLESFLNGNNGWKLLFLSLSYFISVDRTRLCPKNRTTIELKSFFFVPNSFFFFSETKPANEKEWKREVIKKEFLKKKIKWEAELTLNWKSKNFSWLFCDYLFCSGFVIHISVLWMVIKYFVLMKLLPLEGEKIFISREPKEKFFISRSDGIVSRKVAKKCNK